jgi:hypothetical protein
MTTKMLRFIPLFVMLLKTLVKTTFRPRNLGDLLVSRSSVALVESLVIIGATKRSVRFTLKI